MKHPCSLCPPGPGDTAARRFARRSLGAAAVAFCGLLSWWPGAAVGQVSAVPPGALSEADLFPDDFRPAAPSSSPSNRPAAVPSGVDPAATSHHPRPYPNPRDVFARPAAPAAQDVIHQVAYENSVAGEPMYVGGSPVAAPAPAALATPSTAAPQSDGLLPEEVFAPPAGGYAGPPMGPPAGPMAGPIAGPGGWMAESPVNPQIPFTGHDVVVPDPWEHTNEIHVFDIRAGASIPVAGGVYADRLDVGWTIEASGRVLLDWPGEQVVPFVELGGGFIGNQAQRGATSPIGGTLTTSLNGATIAQANVNSLVDAELKSMQRGYVHLALGSRIAVPWQDVREAFNLTARAGMRVGHVHARFDETLTPAVQNLISQGRLVNPNLAFDAQSALEKTDIFWGVLAGVGASTPYRSIWLHGVWVGDMTCGLECDYVHDFFDLGQFDNGSHGLGSVNLLTTWTIRR